MKRTLYSLLLLLLFLIGLVGTVLLVRSGQRTGGKAVETATLSLSTPSTTVTSGSNLAVNIIIAPSRTALAGVDVRITYPSDTLEAKTFEKGALLSLVLKPPRIDRREATMILASAPKERKKDGGILATLTFKAVKEGQATITFDPATKIALVGQRENAAGTLPSLTITVVNPTPPPTNTPTPTQQPLRR